MRKKLLIYAHYYAPDMASTGQILKDQAEGMLDAFDVTVICVVPSYIGTIAPEYTAQKYYYEEMNGVKLIRIRVPGFTKSSKISRVKNIIVYFFGALGASRKAGKQDYVFTVSQPPILGGLLGVIGKWQKRAKMIYCIQDFNPEQIMAVNYSKNKLILRAMMLADKFSCRHADLVVTVGRDLVETLKNRFHNRNVPKHVMINNWIDEKEVYPLPIDNEMVQTFRKEHGLEDKFVIMYSGNIGLYYDLRGIIKVIERFKGARTPDGREVAFAFVGAGSVLDELVLYKKEHGLDNVIFIPYQDKDKLIYSLNAADVHWCVNAKGIKGVSCPSKFYGIIGVGKPVLAVLEQGSEVQMLIDEIGCGLVCEPGDYETGEKNISWFIERAGSAEVAEMGERGHAYFEQHLTKDASVQKYINAIRGV